MKIEKENNKSKLAEDDIALIIRALRLYKEHVSYNACYDKPDDIDKVFYKILDLY